MKTSGKTVDRKIMLEVASAIIAGKDAASSLRLLEELLTPAECQALALRWMLMKQLSDGVPQRMIAKNLSISPCKITRGSRILKDSDSVCHRIFIKSK